MKLVAFSDLHLRVSDNLSVPTVHGLNSRIEHRKQAMETMIDYARDRKIGLIVDLGDTFDTINPPDRLRIVYAGLVKQATDAGIQWIRVLGNHENDGMYGVGVDAGYFSDKYIVVQNSLSVPLSVDTVLFVPELPVENVCAILKRFPNDMVLGHFGVAGAIDGIDPVDDRSVPQSLFAKRKYPTFLGHIHKRQSLCKGKVQYIGAICRKDFGDADIPTGFCVIETKTGEHEFVSLPDIGLLTLEVREGQKLNTIKCKPGDVVKLPYVGTRKWWEGPGKDSLHKLSDHLRKCGAVRIYESYRSTDDRSVESVTVESPAAVEKLLRQRAKLRKLDISVGLAYLNKAYALGERGGKEA